MKLRVSKKLLSLLIAVIMLLSIAPFNGLGELFATKVNAETEGPYTFTVEDGKATITEFDNTFEGDVEIPPTFGEYPVTSIGKDAFIGCKKITSVKMPDSITTIGNGAFWRCEKLKSVTLSNNLTNIGMQAFGDCYLLESVTIPNGLTEIEFQVFYQCTLLKSITIPRSVKTIGEGAFEYCWELKDVYYCGTDADWEKIDINVTNNYHLLNADVHYINLPVSSTKTARYKNNVTVEITATGIPAGGVLVVDGEEFPQIDGRASIEIKFQADSSKTFNAQIKDSNGTVISAEDYKVNVDTGFFAKLSAFFMDFLFTGFKWRSATIEF